MPDSRTDTPARIVPAVRGPGERGLMAEREPAGPFCFDCVHYPEAPADLEESAPDRAAGRNLTAEFFCPQIRRRVPPTYAARCDEYQEAAPEE